MDYKANNSRWRQGASLLAGRQLTRDIPNLFTFNFTKPVPQSAHCERRSLRCKTGSVGAVGRAAPAPVARRSPRGTLVAQPSRPPLPALWRCYDRARPAPPAATTSRLPKSRTHRARALKGHFLRRWPALLGRRSGVPPGLGVSENRGRPTPLATGGTTAGLGRGERGRGREREVARGQERKRETGLRRTDTQRGRELVTQGHLVEWTERSLPVSVGNGTCARE